MPTPRTSTSQLEAYRQIEDAARQLDHYQSREEIHKVLDDLEFAYELVDPEMQDQVTGLIERLTQRLRAIA